MNWFVYKILHLFKKVFRIYLLFVKRKPVFCTMINVKLPNADTNGLYDFVKIKTANNTTELVDEEGCISDQRESI